MADVDTEMKRRGIDQLPGLEILPLPSGTVDVYEMAMASDIYGGIAFAPAPWGYRIRKSLLLGVY